MFYLPGSPRWLLGEGHLLETKNVLRTIRGSKDVLINPQCLFEGLGVGVWLCTGVTILFLSGSNCGI
ncbi:hypothetical protein Leryth_024467 [Lithospermum erythrorhizon]|nr:hypothetical protein Leryth_024467 [Lithospermum erythrorhizon]